MILCNEKRVEEVEAQLEHLTDRVDRLRDSMYGDEFLSRVAYALRKVLDTNQAITITHYVNDKEVTTKLVRDELKELQREESELSTLLDNIRDIKEKYGGRK